MKSGQIQKLPTPAKKWLRNGRVVSGDLSAQESASHNGGVAQLDSAYLLDWRERIGSMEFSAIVALAQH